VQLPAGRVVVDYVFMRGQHVSCFHEAFACPVTPVHMFTLRAPLHVVQARERERVGRSPLGQAVEDCWREIECNVALLGESIDAGTTSAAEVAATIARAVARRGASTPK
jgi:hypothetical protein